MSDICYYSPSVNSAWTVMEPPTAEFLAAHPWPEDTMEVPPPPPNGGIPHYDGGVFSWEEMAPLPVPRTPQIIASAKLSIAEGMISGFAADSAIAGGFAMDTGKFLMFFGSPQPDVDYIVNVFDGGLYRCYVQPDDYSTDSFVITTTDLAGTPADPACISIIIMRAI